MKRLLEPYHIHLEVKHFYVPEIQADSCKEVAEFSASYAANKCGKPVIKADSGLFIDALGGLPGVYTSQFQKQIGPLGIIKLMKDITNRKASIVYALSYCEPHKPPITFEGGSSGTIAQELHGTEGMIIDYLFIPRGTKKTLGEIKQQDKKKADYYWGNAELSFTKWFLRTRKNNH